MRPKHSLLMIPLALVVWWLWPKEMIRVARLDGLELRCRLEGLSAGDEHGHSVGSVRGGFLVGAPYHEGGVARLYSRGCTVSAEWRGGPQDDLGCAVNGVGDLAIVGIEHEEGDRPGEVEIRSKTDRVRSIEG